MIRRLLVEIMESDEPSATTQVTLRVTDQQDDAFRALLTFSALASDPMWRANPALAQSLMVALYAGVNK